MRKLKIALVLLFAMLMSLALFACKKPAQDVDYISTIRDVSKVPALTDSDTETTWNTKKNQIEVSVRLVSADPDTISGEDCTFTHNIQWGVVGTYSVTITPSVSQDPSATAKSITIEVEVTHNFGTEDANGNSTCAFCQAQRTRLDTDVTLQYGMFHSGWADTNEDDGFWVDEKQVVFGDDSTIPEGPFQPFGSVTHNYGQNRANTPTTSREVPTVTVGHLEKGMTIQVTGAAYEAKPEDVQELWYFFPIIGVADRYNNMSENYPYYVGGTSVIVRNDGHVLYNGIGEGNNNQHERPNVLGALAGNFNENGFPNYGSGTKAEATLPDGYGSLGVLPSVSEWKNWYVYSTSDGSIRSDTYSTEKYLTLTWYYRDDGVIEMTYVAWSSASTATFKCYVKVPDSPNGYYETILHGEYTHMTFNEYSVIETSPISGLRFKQVDNDGLYYENEMLDATALSFETQSKKTSEWSAVKLPANQIYAYTGELEGGKVPATAKAYNEADTLWVSLANTPMNTSMKAFMAVIEKANGDVFTADITAGAIKVVPNAVVAASGADNAGFPNNGKVGVYSVDAAKSGENYKIVLTPASSDTYWAQEIGAQTGWTGTPDANARYISLILEAGALGEFALTDLTFKSGTAEVPYIISLSSDNKVAHVVLALVAANVENGVTITGLNATPVEINLSNVKGFNVISSVNNAHLSLMGGGYYVATYKISKTGVAASAIFLNFGGGFATQNVALSTITNNLGSAFDENNLAADQWQTVARSYNVQVGYIESNGGVSEVKVAVKANAPDLENLSTLQIRLYFDNANGLEADDTVYYPMNTFEGNVGEWYAKASGTSFTLIKAFDISNLGATHENVTLNLNAGEDSKLKLLELGYEITANGEYAFMNNAVNEYASIKLISFGTFNNDSDTDNGYIVIITVDVTQLGVRVGTANANQSYYFQVNGESDIYQVVHSGNVDVVSEAELTVPDEMLTVEKGDCWNRGIIANIVESEGKVIFYANLREVAGDHNFGTGNECLLCGAEREFNTNVTNVWFVAGHPSVVINDGDILEYRGTYTENSSGAGYAGTVAVFLEETKTGWNNDSNGTYHFTNDGYVYWTNFGWNMTRFPYADIEGFNAEDNDPTFKSSLITEEHPFNTGNGWTNGNGVELTESGFEAAKRGGTFRYVITYTNGKVEVRVQLFAPETSITGMPYFEYTASVEVEEGAKYEAKIFFKQQEAREGALVDNKIEIVKSKVNRSVLESAESGTVTLGAATVTGNGANFTKSGVNLVASGMSNKMTDDVKAALGLTDNSYTHYVAFNVNFSKALSETTSVVVRNSAGAVVGKAVYANETIGVVIPLNADTLGVYTIELTNFEGATIQSNFTVDLSNVIVSNISTEVSDGVTLTGGTFTITYKGELPAGVQLGYGDAKVALPAAGTGLNVALGAFKITSVTKSGDETVVTIEAPAFDLTKVVSGYTIRLLDNSGNTLAENTVGSLQAGDLAELGSTGYYASVIDGKLVIAYLSNDAINNMLFALNINGGANTPDGFEYLVRYYDLSYSVVDGAVVLAGAPTKNMLTRAADMIVSQMGNDKLVAFCFDLSKVKTVDAAKAFGFELVTGSENAVATVDASTHAVTVATASDLEGDAAASEIYEASEHYGVSAKVHGAVYYSLAMTSLMYEFDGTQEGLQTATGASFYNGWATQKEIPAANLSGIATKGLTLMFKMTEESVDNDWNIASLEATGSNMQLGLPNLHGLGVTVPAGVSDATKALVQKVTENVWPGLCADTYNGFVAGDTFMGGTKFFNSYITVVVDPAHGVTYYLNGAMQVDYPNAGKGNGDFTVGDFVNAFLALAQETGVTIAPKGCSAGNVLLLNKASSEEEVEVLYYDYLVQESSFREIAPPAPEYTPDSEITKQGGLVIGTDGTQDGVNWTGYNNNPNWIGKLELGDKIVITGTQKSLATEPFWSSLTTFVWSGYMPTPAGADQPGICMNHANAAAGHGEAWTISVPDHKLTGGDDFVALVKEVGADCNVTITFDWSQYKSQIFVIFKIEKGEKAVETTYTLTGTSSMDAFYNVGIGVDNSYAVLTGITKTNNVPSADLPAHTHQYVNGGCTICEAVQPASELTDWTSVDKTISAPDGWDTASGELAQKISKGGVLYVVGSQSQNFANHNNASYYSMVFEFAEGYTFTSADNGWTYGDGEANFGAAAHRRTRLELLNTSHGLITFTWDDMMAIVSDCNWRMAIDWTNEDLLTITLTMTAKSGTLEGCTYAIEYTLPVINSELDSLTLKVGADHVDSVKIDVCKFVEVVDSPAQEHDYVDGLCTICGRVQDPSEVGGTAVEHERTETGFAPNAWSPAGVVLKDGGKVVVYGTQTSAVASNWHTLNFEVNTGDPTKSATFRTDWYGWYWDDNPAQNVDHKVETGKSQKVVDALGNNVEEIWGNYVDLMKDCVWRVELSWVGNEILVTFTSTSTSGNLEGYTYTQTYSIDVTGQTTATIGFGAEACTYSIDCYTTSGLSD